MEKQNVMAPTLYTTLPPSMPIVIRVKNSCAAKKAVTLFDLNDIPDNQDDDFLQVSVPFNIKGEFQISLEIMFKILNPNLKIGTVVVYSTTHPVPYEDCYWPVIKRVRRKKESDGDMILGPHKVTLPLIYTDTENIGKHTATIRYPYFTLGYDPKDDSDSTFAVNVPAGSDTTFFFYPV